MTIKSPYQNLPRRQFWRTSVAKAKGYYEEIYAPKFLVKPEENIMTAGSCFAQHIARHFLKRGFKVIDAEPAPRQMTKETAKKFNYGVYSARYANIYTVRQLLQLIKEAMRKPEEIEAVVWEKDGRFYDAMRPSIEPNGFESAEEATIHRRAHLNAVLRAIKLADIFIFTLGLTEAWIDKNTGLVYASAPGTIAGSWNPEEIVFHNFDYQEILADFLEFREIIKSIRPDIKFLITVSPVPLAATAMDSHILPATIYSKSVLRAVAGALAAKFYDIDYFPSYEIIMTPFLREVFYDESLREVTSNGVERVMKHFFCHYDVEGQENTFESNEIMEIDVDAAAEEVICEEVLLEAFAK